MYDTSLLRDIQNAAAGRYNCRTARHVLKYIDFPMFIETTPDQNGNAWFYMQTFVHPIAGRFSELRFDIDASDARAIIAALQEYLTNLEKSKEENHA